MKDHNEIRDAAADVDRHEVGSTPGVRQWSKPGKPIADHMAEEERQDLADFRHHADFQLRHDIAVSFATFEANHPGGINVQDKDPDTYVSDQT